MHPPLCGRSLMMARAAISMPSPVGSVTWIKRAPACACAHSSNPINPQRHMPNHSTWADIIGMRTAAAIAWFLLGAGGALAAMAIFGSCQCH